MDSRSALIAEKKKKQQEHELKKSIKEYEKWLLKEGASRERTGEEASLGEEELALYKRLVAQRYLKENAYYFLFAIVLAIAMLGTKNMGVWGQSKSNLEKSMESKHQHLEATGHVELDEIWVEKLALYIKAQKAYKKEEKIDNSYLKTLKTLEVKDHSPENLAFVYMHGQLDTTLTHYFTKLVAGQKLTEEEAQSIEQNIEMVDQIYEELWLERDDKAKTP